MTPTDPREKAFDDWFSKEYPCAEPLDEDRNAFNAGYTAALTPPPTSEERGRALGLLRRVGKSMLGKWTEDELLSYQKAVESVALTAPVPREVVNILRSEIICVEATLENRALPNIMIGPLCEQIKRLEKALSILKGEA
jgi:hypothetical protein